MPEFTYHYRIFNLLSMQLTRKIGTLKKDHPELSSIIDRCFRVNSDDYPLHQHTSIDQKHQDYLQDIESPSNVIWSTLMAAGDRPFQYKSMLMNIKKKLVSSDEDKKNEVAWIEKVRQSYQSCQSSIIDRPLAK